MMRAKRATGRGEKGTHLFDSTLLAMTGSREQTVLPTKCLQLLRDVRTLAGGRVADGTQRQLFQVLVGRMVVFAAKLRVGIAKALRCVAAAS